MTIVEQLKAMTADRDAFKTSIDAVTGELAEAKTQIAALTSEVEAGKSAVAELATLKASIADKDSAINAAGAKIDEQAKQIADLTAKLTHAPAPYADATDGRDPLKEGVSDTDSKTFAQLHAEYSRITDPKAREDFRNQHAKALGITK